jgi:hypothetical protein
MPSMIGKIGNGARSIMDPLVWLHSLRILHFYGYCSSSDNLRPLRHFEKGGSGSSRVKV